MATKAPARVSVATSIEPELRKRLEEKRLAADRSEAAEIRQAIRAWVETTTTGAAS